MENDVQRNFWESKVFKLILGALVVLLVGLGIFLLLTRFTKKSENFTLVYWGLWEDEQIFQPVIAEFERLHPNIRIDYKKQDIKALEKYAERLATRINNGTGPDVFRFHNTWLLPLGDFLLPLPQDVVSETLLSSQYFDVVKRDLQKNGAYFGIPLGIDTLSLFINEDIFKSAGREPPGNWDDFIATARALTVKDQTGNIKTAGAALGTFDNVDHASDILSLLFIQNGADLLDLGGAGKKNAVDALDFYISFAKDEGAVWSANMPKSKLAFAKGELAMYFGYSWDLYDIRALNPNLNFKIVPVPRLPGRSMTIASYWAEGVSSKTKHPKEAFEFLKFLAKKENISRLYENETKILGYGRPYARKDMAGLLSVSPLYPFVAGAENAFSTPFSSDTYDGGFNSVLNAYLNNAVNSVLNGSVSTDTAVDTLAKGVSGVISRYEKKQQANTGGD